MALSLAGTKRLARELATVNSGEHPENVYANAAEDNLALWYFLVDGPVGSPYEGGSYLGTLQFPPNYPFAPPAIKMLTPSGRFIPDTRLCISMSDFHPEDWSPLWGPLKIAVGVLSFMLDMKDVSHIGGMDTTVAIKKKLAAASSSFNMAHPMYGKLFPAHKAAAEAAAKAADSAAPPKVSWARAAMSSVVTSAVAAVAAVAGRSPSTGPQPAPPAAAATPAAAGAVAAPEGLVREQSARGRRGRVEPADVVIDLDANEQPAAPARKRSRREG